MVNGKWQVRISTQAENIFDISVQHQGSSQVKRDEYIDTTLSGIS